MPIAIDDRVSFLKDTQLLRGLNLTRLREIAEKFEERECQAGEVVINQGKIAERLYLIYSGKVKQLANLEGDGEETIELVAGNYFGEESLARRAIYGKTMTALENTLLLELERPHFNLLPSLFIHDRVNFIRHIHLFYGLNDDQLQVIAEELDEQKFEAGEEIIQEGIEGASVFLIYSGKVRVTRKGVEKPLATFVTGDYMGEESVLSNRHRRTATVTAIENTFTLVLTRALFHKLLKQAPSLQANFAVTANSHRLARKIHFSWIQPDEVIYFMARKHPILLVQMLILPVLLTLAAVTGMLISWLTPVASDASARMMETTWYIALAVGLGAAAWNLWNIMDWSNDYYIVTDRRVVWLEKVVGIYDSRQETPLSAIQRVNVQTKLTGRVLDYGDVIVRTIVGSTLNLRNIDHPYQAAALMEEHWNRSKLISRKMEEEEMHQALRARLLEGEHKPDEIKGIIAADTGKKNPYRGQHSIANLFRMRFEHLTTVTYRKHMFVLFQQTWKAGVVVIALLGILIYALVAGDSSSISVIVGDRVGLAVLLWFLLFLGGFGWWLYEYIDWSNDIFQVTPDQIMDIDKTPLGEVTSDIAALDNILSIEYKRRGILELLFNYGTVYITIGGGKQMAFENVFNPAAVQDDIERRRLERITNKEKANIKAERERIADWFAAYYNKEDNIRGESENIEDIWRLDPAVENENDENNDEDDVQ